MNRKRRRSTKRNITVRLDRQAIRQARILAARRETSLSAFLAEQIQSMSEEEQAYQRAKRVALKLLEQGFHFGGGKLPSRSELHER